MDCAHFWSPQLKWDGDCLKGFSKGLLEHLSYEEMLRELELSGLERIRPRGDLINAYKHFKSGCQEDEGRVFSVVPSNSGRSE